MKRKIYLFCNKTYGRIYQETFRASRSLLHDFDLYVVYSVRARDRSTCLQLARYVWYKTTNLFSRAAHKYFSAEVSVLRVADVNSSVFIRSIPAGSIAFVAGFNQIFKKPVIAQFTPFINFHPSLLPHYRGAIPSYWVIRNGEASTGFTAHEISQDIDAGKIIYQEHVEINPGMTESELDGKIAAAGAFYFGECLRAIVANKPFRQRCAPPTYAHPVDIGPATRVE